MQSKSHYIVFKEAMSSYFSITLKIQRTYSNLSSLTVQMFLYKLHVSLLEKIKCNKTTLLRIEEAMSSGFRIAL